jgi:serine/threonine protein kinase
MPCEPESAANQVVGKVYKRPGSTTEKREIEAMRMLRQVIPHIGAYANEYVGTCLTRNGRSQLLIKRADHTLRECMSARGKNRKDPFRVFGMLINVMIGLNELNAHGLAHFDMSPDNIMWRASDDRFVLVDFGNLIQHTHIFSRRHNPFLAVRFAYNPPEFLLASSSSSPWKAADSAIAAPKADVYGFGVLLLWVARQPFAGAAAPLFRKVGARLADKNFRTRPTTLEAVKIMQEHHQTKNSSGVMNRIPTFSANLRSQSEKSSGRPAASPTKKLDASFKGFPRARPRASHMPVPGLR